MVQSLNYVNAKLNTYIVNALNYGIGGYSSTTELMTLIEVKRYDKYIKYAIFYDGVNEVGRYIEYLQKGSGNPIYKVIGYPYFWPFHNSLRNI